MHQQCDHNLWDALARPAEPVQNAFGAEALLASNSRGRPTFGGWGGIGSQSGYHPKCASDRARRAVARLVRRSRDAALTRGVSSARGGHHTTGLQRETPGQAPVTPPYTSCAPREMVVDSCGGVVYDRRREEEVQVRAARPTVGTKPVERSAANAASSSQKGPDPTGFVLSWRLSR
jgi:hypothetical protein